MAQRKNTKKRRSGNTSDSTTVKLLLISIAAVIIIVFASVIGFILTSGESPSPILGQITQETTTEEDKTPVITSTVTIGSAGDILIHSPLLDGAAKSDGSYDFNKLFTYITPRAKEYDYFVLNLETTLAGNENRKYSTYPRFNTPDSLLDSLTNMGTDMLLTANNHSYDTGADGFLRTAEKVGAAGFDHTGSFLKAEDKRYHIENVGGINFGLICYTYETSYDSDTVKALNGLPMNSTTSPLINSFDYDHIDTFYTDIEKQLGLMKQDGAEVLTVYMHWGDEYKLSANSWQKKMAQKLCDLGVDVIIGGHPHVVEPVELITSTDGESKTVCLYSMGNFVSNQRRNLMGLKTGHTEDGAIFEMTFSKYSDGSVYFEEVGVTPTWVHLYKENGKQVHSVVPLSENMDAASLGLDKTDAGLSNAKASYERTMELVGAGLDDCNQWLDTLERPDEAYRRMQNPDSYTTENATTESSTAGADASAA